MTDKELFTFALVLLKAMISSGGIDTDTTRIGIMVRGDEGAAKADGYEPRALTLTDFLNALEARAGINPGELQQIHSGSTSSAMN